MNNKNILRFDYETIIKVITPKIFTMCYGYFMNMQSIIYGKKEYDEIKKHINNIMNIYKKGKEITKGDAEEVILYLSFIEYLIEDIDFETAKKLAYYIYMFKAKIILNCINLEV